MRHFSTPGAGCALVVSSIKSGTYQIHGAFSEFYRKFDSTIQGIGSMPRRHLVRATDWRLWTTIANPSSFVCFLEDLAKVSYLGGVGLAS
jgi:hypothetical protein